MRPELRLAPVQGGSARELQQDCRDRRARRGRARGGRRPCRRLQQWHHPSLPADSELRTRSGVRALHFILSAQNKYLRQKVSSHPMLCAGSQCSGTLYQASLDPVGAKAALCDAAICLLRPHFYIQVLLDYLLPAAAGRLPFCGAARSGSHLCTQAGGNGARVLMTLLCVHRCTLLRGILLCWSVCGDFRSLFNSTGGCNYCLSCSFLLLQCELAAFLALLRQNFNPIFQTGQVLLPLPLAGGRRCLLCFFHHRLTQPQHSTALMQGLRENARGTCSTACYPQQAC